MKQSFTERLSTLLESTTTFKEITYLPEFERDMRKLTKKYQTLPDDIAVFINTPMKLFHRAGINTADIRPIAGLRLGAEEPTIYKARRFACRSLKGRGSQTGIRIIYAYFTSLDSIEFVEIYFKANQSIQNNRRILQHYKTAKG